MKETYRMRHHLPIAEPDNVVDGLSPSPWMLMVVTFAAVFFCSIPFWTGPWLGMVDYPNHLARYFVIAHHDNIPALQDFYQVRWQFIANIGLDVIIQAVQSATSLPTERVSQILVGVLCVLLIPAVLCLNRALFGLWSYWPITSALLVFNYVLLYGFTNYVVGLTLAIFLMAAWVTLREHPLVLLLPAFATGATALFLFHLYAFAIYGLFWLCLEAWSLWIRRGSRGLLTRQAAAALQFLPALAILLLLSPTSGNINLQRIKLSTPWDKLIGLYSVFDIGVWSITLATFVVFGLATLLGLLSRKLVFSPPGAIAVGAFLVTFLAMPFTLLGSGFADYRLPIAITAVFIAATRWHDLPRRAALILSAVLVILVVVRVAAMTSEWALGNQRYAEIMRAMAPMQSGRRLLTVIADEDVSARFLRHPPIDNASALAVITRQAFVPTLFAEPEKQPISFTAAVAPFTQYKGSYARLYDALHDPLATDVVAPYDYVLVFARTPLRRETPSHLVRIDDGTVADLALFAVRRKANSE